MGQNSFKEAKWSFTVLQKMSSQSNNLHKLKIKKHQTYDLKLWRGVTGYKQNEN